MNKYLNAAQCRFSPAGFKALPRNADGDIVGLEMAFRYLTHAQMKALTPADRSRVGGFIEEMMDDLIDLIV